jgi:hypothetical protein
MCGMHPVLRSALALTGTLALLGPTTHAVADGGGTPPPRAQLLARGGHGAAVVSALGDKLSAAARTNRMSSRELASVLESDHTAWLGADGQLFYKEAAEAVSLTSTVVAPISPAIYPTSQTFALHSDSASTHKIFLDFDGAAVSNTWWNSSYNTNPMPNRTYSGFTLDADPTTFNASEHAYIQEVWRIVAEKYAAFDVDVTTEDPGTAGYNRSNSADTSYGDHVVITNDSSAATSACGGCSGVALVGTFNITPPSPDYYQPAWVFSSMTHNSPVLTAHTVAHEVGHTLGLKHDGTVVNGTTTEYSSGHGNWFPLMGSSVNAVGQFSKGEYANANNPQDDLADIASDGAPVRVDDVGDTTAVAAPLAAGTLFDGVITPEVDAVLHRTVGTDDDVFVVDHGCATPLTARATGIGPGQALDIKVTILSAGGTELASADPASGQNTAVWPYEPTGMDSSVTVSAPAGTYYVRVDGVGTPDPVNSGYSTYASIGEYQLAVSTCDGTLPPSTMPQPTPTDPTTTTPGAAGAPSAPGVGLASSGRRGHPVTAVARWNAPASNGGAAITGYQVRAERLSRSGRVLGSVTSRVVGSGSHALTMRLRKGKYRFRIVAFNAAGASPYSAASRVVVAR